MTNSIGCRFIFTSLFMYLLPAPRLGFRHSALAKSPPWRDLRPEMASGSRPFRAIAFRMSQERAALLSPCVHRRGELLCCYDPPPLERIVPGIRMPSLVPPKHNVRNAKLI